MPSNEIGQVFDAAVVAALADDAHGAAKLLSDLDELALTRDVDLYVEGELVDVVERAWSSGWQPLDIVQHVRRQADDRATAFVHDAIALEAARYAPATIDGRWAQQLDELGANSQWWPSDIVLPAAWADKHGLDRVDVWLTVAAVVGRLRFLPRLRQSLPLPGSATARAAAGTAAVDEKMLARVRALLAKAESTDFPDEAEALSGKAQELMTKFSLDRVLVELDTGADGESVGERRIWIDKPYVTAKAMLVSAAGRANRCQSVLFEKIGFISVVGDHADLRLVEVLATSLLVQANRAMLAQGAQRNAWGQSRTRSYRQSFLVSYASRIGERLEEGAEAARAQMVEDDRLLPALAARDAKVEDKFHELFPDTRPVSVAASNPVGWRDGRLAADMANLDVRSKLSS